MRRQIPKWVAFVNGAAFALGLLLVASLATAQRADSDGGRRAARERDDQIDYRGGRDSDAPQFEDDDSDRATTGRQQGVEGRRPLRERPRDDDVERQWLGVRVRDTGEGELEILGVAPDSPAESAGLERGDRLMSAAGRQLDSPEELGQILQDARPGEWIELEVMRDGRRQWLEAELQPAGRLGTRRETRRDDAEDFEEGRLGRLRERAREIGERLGERIEDLTEQLADDEADDGQRAERRRAGRPAYDEDEDDLRSRSARPALGVTLTERGGRVEIRTVAPDSPADQARLRPGDQIVFINGQQVTSPEELVELVAEADPRDDVLLVILRDGRQRQVSATLAARREVFDGPRGREDDPYRSSSSRPGALGVTLQDTRRGEVHVGSVYEGSPADEAGLERGDRILAIEGRRVSSAGQVIGLLGRMRAGQRVELDIVRDGERETVRATLAARQEAFEQEPRSNGQRQERFYRGQPEMDQYQDEEQLDFGDRIRDDARDFGSDVLRELGEVIFNE